MGTDSKHFNFNHVSSVSAIVLGGILSAFIRVIRGWSVFKAKPPLRNATARPPDVLAPPETHAGLHEALVFPEMNVVFYGFWLVIIPR